MNDAISFFNQYASAIFALLGIVIGGLLGILGNVILSEKELRLRLLEKTLSRRIEAHESIIELSKSLRAVHGLDYLDANGELARFTAIMRTRAEFNQWWQTFYETFYRSSTWLSTNVQRELNLLQDYLVNLRKYRVNATDAQMVAIGQIVRQDFVDFSSSIEIKAFQYISKDLKKLIFNDLSEHHKYSLKETLERLDKTALMRNANQLTAIIQAEQAHGRAPLQRAGGS